MSVHRSSIISKKARLDKSVEVGPYCVIGDGVRIGKGTKLFSHVCIEGDTELGARCTLFPGVVLGTPAQARLSKPSHSSLLVGDDNVFREYTTVHASMKSGGRTVIGHRNFLMANSHVAHDCVLGNDITLANLATLGGHVQVEDGAVIGGLVGVHQFVRIGRLAMIGAFSKLAMDVPPFALADGRLATFHGINAVGLKRAGYSPARRSDIRKALKTLFAEGGNLSAAVSRVRRDFKGNADIEVILSFIASSKRGLMRSGTETPGAGDE